MKQLFFAILFVCSNFIFAQTKVTDTITSQKLNEDREITISLPPSYEKNKTKKYPVLVLLDSDFLLDPFQGNLNYGYFWDDLPEMIVVGINQNNKRDTDCVVDDQNGLPSEKGENFFEFIGSEVLPYIEKKYRIAPFRMIAGLDTTAGFLNFYLYKDTPIFDAYMSFSPELARGMEEQIPERLSVIQKPIFYYVSSADGDPIETQDKIKTMAGLAKKITNPKFNFRYENFENASHYSLVLHSIPSALYQIFSLYQPISIKEFKEKIAPLSSGYVDYLIKKYEVLENSFGLKLQIRISDFKAIEAAILKNKDYNEFDKLAQLAQKNYPKSMLANYEMGLMYEKKRDIKNAVKNYQSAYQMQEIGDLTKEMMLNKIDELKGVIKEEKNKVQETPEEVPAETVPEKK